MKHSTKAMLRSALILFVAGLLLTTSCYIYAAAKDIDIYGTSSSKSQYVSYTETMSEVLERSPDSEKANSHDPFYPYFKSIDASSQVGSIVIKCTKEDSYIEYENVDVNNLVCKIVGNTLEIGEINPVNFMGVSIKQDGIAFDGLRQVFNKKSTLNKDRKITVYVNEQMLLENISASANVGEVVLDGITASEIMLNIAYGKAEVSGCSVPGGTIKINGDISDVVFENNEYSMCNVSVIKGDISAIVSSCKSNFETSLGAISVVTLDNLETYTLRMFTNYGTVKLDGEKAKGTEYNQAGSSGYVWMKAGFGNLSVSAQNVADLSGEERKTEETKEPELPEPEIDLP